MIFSIFAFTVQSSIIITPLTININLVGGETVEKQILITNDGTTTATIHINTAVLPDSNGIEITYSVPPSFILLAKSTQIITMSINTSFYLSPMSYTIETFFSGEVEPEQITAKVHKTFQYGNITSPVPPINETYTPPIIPEIPTVIYTDVVKPPSNIIFCVIGVIFLIILLFLVISYIIGKHKGDKQK